MYGIIILTVLGMLYANRQYNAKGVIWGRPLAGFLGTLTVVLATVKVLTVISSPTKSRENIIKKEQRYLHAAAHVLGDYIATNYPTSKILLITHATTHRNKKSQKKIVKFLEKGLMGKALISAIEYPAPADVDSMKDPELNSSDESAITAVSFDLMVDRHPNCNLVVSLIGLPADYEEMRFWSIAPEERPKLIIALGNPYRLKTAIETDYISAIISLNPGYKHDLKADVPENYTDVFRERFLLINKENLGVVAKSNPGLFMKEDSS